MMKDASIEIYVNIMEDLRKFWTKGKFMGHTCDPAYKLIKGVPMTY
jgi:hypothetical protein